MADGQFVQLREAVRKLYYAAVWHADRPVDEKALWEAVRDAAGFDLGLSPKEMTEETREQKAYRLIKESGKSVHASDCATSLAPAEEPGPCDCNASEIEIINPFDLADLMNQKDLVDVILTHDEQGEIFEFPKTGKRYRQNVNAPRKMVAEFHTTHKPPVTLPPHCGSVLRIVPKLEEQTMKGKREIERINPFDMSELLRGPADDIVDLLKYEENGESVIEFSRTRERYILDSNVPRRIGVEPMACSDCGNTMIYSGARNKEGLMIYDHPGPCLDKNGNNRFDQEK